MSVRQRHHRKRHKSYSLVFLSCLRVTMLSGVFRAESILGEWSHALVGKPDSTWEASRDLRSLGEELLRISRTLHEHSRKLEVAVEGTYAGESGDPRVRLLNDSLRICRISDLELGRINQMAQRTLLSLQEQMDRFSQALPSPAATPRAQAGGSFEEERDALNTSIINLERKRTELETLYEIARMLNSTLGFDDVLRLVMDQVIEVVSAERGFLVLLDPATGDLRFEIARDKRPILSMPVLSISRSAGVR